MLSIFLQLVKARPPPASPLGPRQSASTLFNVLCVTGLGSLPTLFILLMCAALFVSPAVKVLSAPK